MTKTLQLLKDWWWLATVIGGALVLWGSIPERVKRVEAGQAKQEEKVSDLREWAAKTQGYIDGQQPLMQQQQRLNERLVTQTANEPLRPAWRWMEFDEDGTCWGCNDLTVDDCWVLDAEDRNGWRMCN